MEYFINSHGNTQLNILVAKRNCIFDAIDFAIHKMVFQLKNLFIE